MTQCIFCRIAKGKSEAKVIYETGACLCFLPLEPESFGHTLIAPKEHFETLWDIEADTLLQIMSAAKELACIYQSSLNCSGFNIFHASGRSAQQSVDHFHLHIFPRFDDDGMDLWPNFPNNRLSQNEMYEAMHNIISTACHFNPLLLLQKQESNASRSVTMDSCFRRNDRETVGFKF